MNLVYLNHYVPFGVSGGAGVVAAIFGPSVVSKNIANT